MMSKQSPIVNNQFTSLPSTTPVVVEENNIEQISMDGDEPDIIPVPDQSTASKWNTEKVMISRKDPPISHQPMSIRNVKLLQPYNDAETSSFTTVGNKTPRSGTALRSSSETNATATEKSFSEDSTSLAGIKSNIMPGNAEQTNIPPSQRLEQSDAAKARHSDFCSDSPNLVQASTKMNQYQNSQKGHSKPSNRDSTNIPPPAHVTYNCHSHAPYEQPHAAIPPYPPPAMQSRHHAAAAAAAVSVAAHKDANMMLLSDMSSAVIMRDQMMGNVPGMSLVQHGTESIPESVAQRNRPNPLYVDSRRNPGGHPFTQSFAVGQHNAAASAAEQHLRWKRNASQNVKHYEATSLPEIIEIDDEAGQKEKLINHFTAAIARQLAGSEASVGPNNSQETMKRNQEFLNWKNQVTNDRKRGLPESTDNNHAPTVMKRQSLANSDGRDPTMYGDRTVTTSRSLSTRGGISSKRVNYGSIHPSQNSSMREVNVNDAMNIALDAAISSDSAQNTKAMSSSGRRVDSPMTYLVRQLLGQVEILGDEPAVVLAPALVRDASNKIRLVINKLIEMIVVKAKKDSQDKIREVEARVDALQQSSFASGREKAVDDAFHQKNFLALKTFAEEKCQQLADRDRQIEYLRTKLESQETEIEDSTIRRNKRSNSNVSYEEKTNATMRHLISRLDEGMTTIQRQQKEIQVLKATIDKDTSSLQNNRDMIPFLKETFGLHDETMTAPNHDEAHNQEIMLLKSEIKELEATINSERRQHQNTLRAYMRAAVHALKIQSGDSE